MSLAENLKRIREKKPMSQSALAKAAGVSQQSISQLERGIDLTSKKLPAIAVALGCRLSDLDDAYAGIAQAAPSQIVEVGTTESERLKARLGEQFAILLQARPVIQRHAIEVIDGIVQASADKSRITKTKEKSSPTRT